MRHFYALKIVKYSGVLPSFYVVVSAIYFLKNRPVTWGENGALSPLDSGTRSGMSVNVWNMVLMFWFCLQSSSLLYSLIVIPRTANCWVESYPIALITTPTIDMTYWLDFPSQVYNSLLLRLTGGSTRCGSEPGAAPCFILVRHTVIYFSLIGKRKADIYVIG